MRIKSRATIYLTLFAIFGPVGFAGSAAAGDDSDSDSDKGHGGSKGQLQATAEIEDLMSCYAYTFDAIARAVAAIPQPLDSELNVDLDPNFAEGLERFRGCTTPDFVIEVRLANGIVLLPAGALPPGPLAWVNLVNNLARDPGPGLPPQINSQHLFGSFSTDVRGKGGTVQAYASITTYFDDGSSSTGTSTYVSDVVRKRGDWLLQKVTLIVN